MNYEQKRVLAIAVAVSLGMLGAVQLANPVDLGISPVAARWLGIVATGLGILAGFLPNVRGDATQPEHIARRLDALTPLDRVSLLADQIVDLSAAERATLRVELERRRNDVPAPVDFDPKEAAP